MTNQHPYCCDEFAKLTNEWEHDEEDDDDDEENDDNYCGAIAAIKQNDDGSWTASFDYDNYQLGPIRFCPFCGKRADTQLGIERHRWMGTNLLHADGSVVRERDIAKDGIYEVDGYDENVRGCKIMRVGSHKNTGGPEFHHKPDLRPVIINGVEALLEDGTPATVSHLREWGNYEFNPETRKIKFLDIYASHTRQPTFHRPPEPEQADEPTAADHSG